MENSGLSSITSAFASKAYAGMDKSAVAKKAHAVAEDFESVYIADAFKSMFKDVSVDPLNGKSDNSNETWRDMLLDQYAKDFVKKGGIGIADGIASELIKIQEGHAG
ncbi:rod-binding protein [Pleomorphomonas oryzae]|uniref:rod-binding protein n=1 Tax=Pleomorphomonas oryzae TaxID=261934 RepID=UPI00041E73CD|nr:rod-binding protein [Pleomorphomonas oryzae]